MKDEANVYSLKFVQYGMGLAVLGLLSGYFPLGHYLLSDAIPSCPSAPVHGHTILLSFVGMSLFGLLYKALPDWFGENFEPPVHLIRLHFRISVIAVIGVIVNGTLGYEFLNHFMQNGFYYLEEEGQFVRNIWFSIDGVFLSLYGSGLLIFLYILNKAEQ